jgi:hypothetical protein
MPQCSNCGTQNLETAKFCTNCGAALQNQPSPLPPQQLSIGSGVSFVASDGKTYTGTVKKIKGDQYRIKYDSSDFETWLNKNQHSIVAVSSTPPVYTPIPNPNVSYTKTSASAAGRSTSPLFITHLGFWGSVMIIIGFFTDWLNFDEGGISGYKILSSARGIINATDSGNTFLIMFIAIAVILLSAVICLFYTISGIGRAAFLLFKILPLLTIISFIAYVIVKVQENTGGLDIPIDSSVWKVLGVGIYLTLVGSLVLAISRLRK